MSRTRAVVVLSIGAAVLALAAAGAIVGAGVLQTQLAQTTSFQPGGDPGYLEYQRLVTWLQMLWQAAPWLVLATFAPLIGALTVAARKPRAPGAIST